MDTTAASQTISRPDPSEYARFYATYVDLVPDGDLLQFLNSQVIDTLDLLVGLSDSEAHFRYAPGKWSVKEVVGHLTDAERVFGYRALRFARGDQTPLSSFDENRYVPAADFDRMPLRELLDDFQVVRQATIRLFRSMKPDWLHRVGEASGYPVSVRALAYITAGHELHHQQILRTRYGLDKGAPRKNDWK